MRNGKPHVARTAGIFLAVFLLVQLFSLLTIPLVASADSVFPSPQLPNPTFQDPTFPEPTFPEPTFPKPTMPKPTMPSTNLPDSTIPDPHLSEQPKQPAAGPNTDGQEHPSGFWDRVIHWVKQAAETAWGWLSHAGEWVGEHWQFVAVAIVGIVLVIGGGIFALGAALAVGIGILTGILISGFISYLLGVRGDELYRDMAIGGILGAFSAGLFGVGLKLAGYSVQSLLSIGFADGFFSSLLDNLLRGQKTNWTRALISGAIGLALMGIGIGLAELVNNKWISVGSAQEAGSAAEQVNSSSGKYTQQQIDNILEELRNGVKSNPLREDYENEVKGLSQLEAELRQQGRTEEKIARQLSQARRDLGVKYKNATPEILREFIYDRNIKKYGDPLGPTFDWLVNYYKGDYQKLIDAAKRPNPDINKVLNGEEFLNWLKNRKN